MRGADSRPFDRGASALLNRTQPRRYKMFLLTWLGIYPLITVGSLTLTREKYFLNERMRL
jgi:antibiotic biosynthesis monooxygenase (ABM) superfamily enzyme